MAEIKFKATRRLHSSGWRALEKSGDLQYDMDANSSDGIWIYVNKPTRVMIDCDKQGYFYLKFKGDSVEIEDASLTPITLKAK